jgi:hypothetical protein
VLIVDAPQFLDRLFEMESVELRRLFDEEKAREHSEQDAS